MEMTTIIHVVAATKLQQSEYYKIRNTTTHRVAHEIYIFSTLHTRNTTTHRVAHEN